MVLKTSEFRSFFVFVAQQKMDYCIAAGMQFTVGDRCQVCVMCSVS